jgi:hypothetical protein
MLPSTTVKGILYSSFELQMENWYDPLSNDFIGMSESELRKKVADDVQRI